MAYRSWPVALIRRTHDAQAIAHMWTHTSGPWCVGSLFPRRGRYYLGRCHMVERDVLQVALGGAEAARARHALHSGKRRDVLVIVPLVEFVFALGLTFMALSSKAPASAGAT